MKYSNNYNEIFSLARYEIRRSLQHDYCHIRDCNKVGVHVSIHTISFVADNLTAYNELLPVQMFISLNNVIK